MFVDFVELNKVCDMFLVIIVIGVFVLKVVLLYGFLFIKWKLNILKKVLFVFCIFVLIVGIVGNEIGVDIGIL